MSNLAHDDDAFRDDREAERHRALEQRLRRLSWPEPPPGVRERSLVELRRQLAEANGWADGAAEGDGGPAVDEQQRRDAG